MEILRMVSVTLSVFVKETTCVAPDVPTVCVPKLRLAGDSKMYVAVPLNVITCGLLVASSVTVTVPVRVLMPVGANVTVIVQPAPAATDDPQVLSSPKSPVLATSELFSVEFPILVNETICTTLLL